MINVDEAIFIVLITFISSVILVPIIKKLAIYVGAMDMPNQRKVHTKPIPRLGGLAIFLSFLIGYMLFTKPNSNDCIMLSILIGSFIIVLTGTIDDIKPLHPKYKFVGQLLAACVLVFYGGITLNSITAFDFIITFNPIVSYCLSIFFILGCINAINLIDGLDGLAGGISSIYFLTIGIIALVIESVSGLDVSLTFIMLGSTLGFLVYNFYPAKIFMGDSGSLFLGFIISIIALLGFKNVTLTSFIVPLLILAIPIIDTFSAIIRRLLKHKSISEPDKEHLHHQFLKMKFSHRNTVLVIYLIDLIFAAASIEYVIGDKIFGIIIYTIIALILIWLITCTNIITEKKSIRNKIKNDIKKIKNKKE